MERFFVSRSLESKSNNGEFLVSGCFSRKEHKGRKGGREVVVVEWRVKFLSATRTTHYN